MSEKTSELQRLNLSQEETIKERTKEAEESKKRSEKATEARGNFLANMSHEIRTPINNLWGLIYFLLQTELSSKQQENLE